MSKEIELLGGLAARKSGGFQTGYSVYGAEGICPTVLSHSGGYGIMTAEVKVIGQMDNVVMEATEARYRIRRLTPRECWRLMGYTDTDFDKAAGVVSNSQLYKQAGNAIVESVLMAIFSQLHIRGVKPWNEMTDDERTRLAEHRR